jgi:hypothetical protein
LELIVGGGQAEGESDEDEAGVDSGDERFVSRKTDKDYQVDPTHKDFRKIAQGAKVIKKPTR